MRYARALGSVFSRIFDASGRILLVLNVAAEKTIVKDGRKQPMHKPRSFGLPGGGNRLDETPFRTARRELWEEGGIKATFIPYGIFIPPRDDPTDLENAGKAFYDGFDPVGEATAENDPENGVEAVYWATREEVEKGVIDYNGEAIPIYSNHRKAILNIPHRIPVPGWEANATQ